jgi:chemotaxis protein methyltransferase CheR
MLNAVQRSEAEAREEIRASDVTLAPAVFKRIQELMYARFGIALGDKKRDLVVSRLADRLRKTRLRTYEDYFRFVTSPDGADELSAMVDALTTNFTSLYREKEHFEFLEQTVLPVLKQNSTISFWSAGCATGEEPYSIACWLVEKLGSLRPQTRILATDISGRALREAQRGAYPEDRFRGLSEEWRKKYLLKGSGQWSNWYLFKPDIRKMIEFQYLNLNDSITKVGNFDVIFCRNVMIYFDQVTRDRLLSRLAHQLNPHGYFLPGHAESLSPVLYGMKRVRPAVYMRTES